MENNEKQLKTMKNDGKLWKAMTNTGNDRKQ